MMNMWITLVYGCLLFTRNDHHLMLLNVNPVGVLFYPKIAAVDTFCSFAESSVCLPAEEGGQVIPSGRREGKQLADRVPRQGSTSLGTRVGASFYHGCFVELPLCLKWRSRLGACRAA